MGNPCSLAERDDGVGEHPQPIARAERPTSAITAIPPVCFGHLDRCDHSYGSQDAYTTTILNSKSGSTLRNLPRLRRRARRSGWPGRTRSPLRPPLVHGRGGRLLHPSPWRPGLRSRGSTRGGRTPGPAAGGRSPRLPSRARPKCRATTHPAVFAVSPGDPSGTLWP